MAMVSIDQLELGMTIGEDVTDTTARLLLTKGTRIEAKHLRILKMWGIFEVNVAATPAAGETPKEEFDTEHLNAAGQDLIKLYSHVDIEHPVIQQVIKLAIPYRAGRPRKDTEIKAFSPQAARADTIPEKNVLQKIERIKITLPEVPSLVFELNEIIADPLSSSADIARLVNQSPSLAAILLKIVNSAFYGFRSKIDSIPRAVVMIGTKEISNLALGISIMETFRDIPKSVMDVASFMRHNLACGIVARMLAAHSNKAATEQLFAAGMLHDIGRLILYKYFPQTAVAMLHHSRLSAEPLLKTERRLTGTTHTQIGKQLIKKWKLPFSLESNIQHHHQPSASPDPESAVLIQTADIIVHGLGIGESGEHKIAAFDTAVWDRLKLPANALSSVIRQSIHQIDQFKSVFNGV